MDTQACQLSLHDRKSKGVEKGLPGQAAFLHSRFPPSTFILCTCSEGFYQFTVFLSQQNHMESCLLLIVSCTNNNCTETMIRKDLNKHVTIGCQWRLVQCSYCNEPHPKCQGEVIIILSQFCFKPTARTLPAEAF